MDQEEKAFRIKRNVAILNAIGRNLLVAFPPKEPLVLGDEFAMRSKRVFGHLAKWRARLVDYLSDLPVDALRSEFNANGRPNTEKHADWFMRESVQIRDYASQLTIWDAAQFDQKNGFADFDYWGKASFLTINEALLLSVGLMPRVDYVHEIDTSGSGGRVDAATAFLRERRLLFRRALDPDSDNQRVSKEAVHRWLEKVDLDVHPGFQRMLERVVQTSPEQPAEPTTEGMSQSEASPVDPREKTSMAKLLLVLAIDAYGYDPKAKRSPIPREIQGVAALRGIEISVDTIRSYLRLGAQYLDADASSD